MKFIDTYKSPNFNRRKKGSALHYIILHYTAMTSSKQALEHMCAKKNKVSSHFFLSKQGDIYYLVDLKYRAWHAGRSSWKGKSDINSESIGIEIDNSGHHCNFEHFNKQQIKSLLKLLDYILLKFKISKHNILGHSDIAPYRKIDPGEKFPWNELKRKNFSFMPTILTTTSYDRIDKYLKDKLVNINKEKRSLYILEKIGYNIKPAINDKKKYVMLIKVYQMHYRQSLVSGKLDPETYKLIKLHFNELLT